MNVCLVNVYTNEIVDTIFAYYFFFLYLIIILHEMGCKDWFIINLVKYNHRLKFIY